MPGETRGMMTPEEHAVYLADLEAGRVDAAEAEAAQAVGGAEALAGIRAWAASNVPKPELDRLNADLAAGRLSYREYAQILDGRRAGAQAGERPAPTREPFVAVKADGSGRIHAFGSTRL